MDSVRYTNDSHSAIERLHHIALHCIFETLFPLYEEELLDCSIYRGPESPWCRRLRTKKALMLVSRNWSPPAATFLYRDVVLPRVSGLIGLAETLRQSPQHGAMIQTLRLDCFIPKSLNKSAGDALSLIFDRCPNMCTLYLGRLFIPSYLTNEWPWESKFDKASVTATVHAISHRAPTPIQHLSFVVDSPVTKHLPPSLLLNQSPHLVSLTISMPNWLADDLDGLSFPNLKQLQVIIARGHVLPKTASIWCLTSWSLPALRSLGLFPWTWMMSPYPDTRVYSADFWKVLEVHGSTLEFLDFSGCRFDDERPGYELSRVCPRLRHLVLSNESPRWPTFHSYSLHVDVWHDRYEKWEVISTMDGDREVARRKAEELHCGSLRYLSKGLHTMPHLPTILPPRPCSDLLASEPSGTLPYHVHDIFGMRILELGSGLLLDDEYPTHDSSSLWRDITPIPVLSSSDPSDSDTLSESDSHDEPCMWDEPQVDDTSSEEDHPVSNDREVET